MSSGGGQRGTVPLAGERIYSARYLNELVLRLCARGDPHSDLFEHYYSVCSACHRRNPDSMALRASNATDDDLGYGCCWIAISNQGDRCRPPATTLLSSRRTAPVAGNANDLRVSGAALLALAGTNAVARSS